VSLRFEDVTQDGRLVLESLPTALGPIVFRGLMQNDPGMRACFEHGVFPIISRLVLHGMPGPFSANYRIEAEATFRVARSEDGRLMLDMWANLYAPIGQTHGSPPADDAERVLAGQVFAEHVFTRPFAPVGQRKVSDFDFPGKPEVRETRSAPPRGEALAALPVSATPLEPSRRPDSTPITFGLCHTDSNMHVNSLIYLRMFEEASLRRFVELGQGAEWLAREVDIAYRKPCFAGQTMRVVQQAFMHEGRLGTIATLVPEPGAEGSPPSSPAQGHTFMRMLFER
jgi:hypothetical protein